MIDGRYHQFILTCLRARWDDAARLALPPLWTELDLSGAQLIKLAKEERLAPLLYHVLRSLAILEPADLEALNEVYAYTAWRNLTIFQELKKVLAQLKQQGVPCLVLKGAALAEPIYDNIALRPLSDIDLLIPHDQVQQTVSFLQELGFDFYYTEPRPGFYLAFENEIVLHKPGHLPIWLEIHWSLFNLPYYQNKIDMDWFWQTAQTAVIQQTDSMVLGTEALLLHLCSHIVLHHRGDELHWLHDIAEVIQYYQAEIDWDLLVDKACAYDLLLPLQMVLPQMKQDWQLPIPTKILTRLADLSLSPMEEKVTKWLTDETRSLALRVWEDLASMPSWGYRWRYIMAYLFPTGDYIRYRHDTPHWLPWPFYYVHHWGRSALNLWPSRTI